MIDTHLFLGASVDRMQEGTGASVWGGQGYHPGYILPAP